MNRRRFLISSGLALLATQVSYEANAKAPLADNIKRVVFLGDSITYAGLYVDYIEAAWRVHYPDSNVEFLDLGLPSETVSGLSEPGHAGGKFPRPNLHERLDRVLAQTQPQLVIACYGMNDGIYYPLSEDRLAAYQQGILTLRRKVEAAGAKIILLTPPVFDAQPIHDKTLPAGLDKYEKPYEGYDDVLARYSDWLLEQRKNGWEVYDIHGPMLQHLKTRRASKPDFLFAKDGVHADATGHWLMAQALLQSWAFPPDAETAAISYSQRRVTQGRINGLQVMKDSLTFSWLTKLPQPYDPKWDAESMVLEKFGEKRASRLLRVFNLTAPSFQIKLDGMEVASLSNKDLFHGVELIGLKNSALQKRGGELLGVIGRRRKLLSDAWLEATGHQRPGMAKGLPLAEANVKAAELAKQIRLYSEPYEMQVELVADGGKKNK